MARPLFDFSYLAHRLKKFCDSLIGQEGGSVDPDDLVELRYKAFDEAEWRIIPLTVVTGSAADLPPGEYCATLFEADPAAPDQRRALREIHSELRPAKVEESNGNAAVYVRACGFAFEQMRGAGAHMSTELERLTNRNKVLEETCDGLRRDIQSRDEEIFELRQQLLEDNGPSVMDVLQYAAEFIQKNPPVPGTPPPATDPQRQIPASVPDAASPEAP